MKKKLIIINGTMGIGKSTTCKQLLSTCKDIVWLDGDWCWMMNPFTVNKETENMVLDNIQHMINNFIACKEYKIILFCWVIQKQEIFNRLIEKINLNSLDLHWITLVSDKDALIRRLEQDKRDDACIKRSCEYTEKFFSDLESVKLDVSKLSVETVAEEIKKICNIDDGGEM